MAQFSLNALRFEDVRSALVEYLKTNSTYNGSFDFSGSNIGYELDVQAYILMILSNQNVLTANNIFIDTTEIRKNAVSIVKAMGYRPKRKISSKFSGSFEYFAADGQTFQSGDTITFAARTRFVTSPSNHIFMNLVPITLTYVNPILLSGDFVLNEGEFKIIETYGTGTSLQEYIIDSTKIEEYNLSVAVRNTNTDRYNNITWKHAESYFSLTDPRVYFVEEDISNEYKPKIIFGDGILGQIPSNTEVIEIEYLETIGDVANNETGVTFESAPSPVVTGFPQNDFDANNLTVVVPDLQVSYGGKDYETLEEIQFNAPRFHSTGGRGVTGDDLISILGSYESTLKYYNVIGGNELYPNDATKRGIGYIAAVPYLDESDFLNNSKIYLTELEENGIIPLLVNKTVLSTDRRFLKPSYVYIELNPFIEVPINFSNEEIQTAITSAEKNIGTYTTENLVGMGKQFRHAKLNSSLTETVGVISSKLDSIFYFIINYASFYSSRQSRMNLPIINQKDSAGQVLFDDSGNTLTTNFIKKRSTIIRQENALRLNTDAYTQFTLPVEKSSIYGSLTHKNTDRFLHNIDVINTEFITFRMVGASQSEVMVYDTFSFEDDDSVTYVPNLYETGQVDTTGDDLNDSVRWQIQLNGRSVAYLDRTIVGGVFSLTIIDEAFLEDFGVIYDSENDPYVNWSATQVTDVGSDWMATTAFTVGNLIVEGGWVLRASQGGTSSGSEPVWTTEVSGVNDTVSDGTVIWTVVSVQNEWVSQTEYAIGDYIVEEGAGSVFYVIQSTQAGTSGSKEPDWVTNITAISDTILQDGYELMSLKYISEILEDGTLNEYYSLFFLLNNEVISDIRVNGINQLCDVQYNPSTSTWSYSNLRTFYAEDVGELSGYREVPLEAYDVDEINEAYLKVVHSESSSEIILSMQNFNGTFSLNNFVDDALVPYSGRNDIYKVDNFTVAQDSSLLSYSFSSLSDPVDTVQSVALKTKHKTSISCIPNVGGLGPLHETFFVCYRVSDGEKYLVWYDEGSGTQPVSESGVDIFVQVVVANGDSAADIRDKTVAAIGALNTGDLTFIHAEADVTDTSLFTIETEDYGVTTDTVDGAGGEATGFTFVTSVIGVDNPVVDIDALQVGDLLFIDTFTYSNNTVDLYNDGYFVIASVDSINGIVTVYNNRGQVDITGVGEITHFKIETGTFGNFSIYGYDMYHQSSIGTLNYESGEIVFNDNVKGYIDLENQNTIIRQTKEIFNNYDSTSKMDSIKITPIDNYSNSGVFLGQLNDFDGVFNQSIQTNITEPIILK